MKVFFVTLFVFLAAAGNAEGQIKTFDFDSQLGIVDSNPETGLCLTIPSATLSEGSRIQVIVPHIRFKPPHQPQSLATAVVQRKLSDSCSTNALTIDHGPNSFYSLTLLNGQIGSDDVGIAVVGTNTRALISSGLATTDLNADGRKEYFRVCSSQEGIHLTVWSGMPLTGRKRWHRYYYVGYDLIPTCKSQDTR